jgi:hypothetical protein
VRDRHQRRCLLVPCLDEVETCAGATERAEDAVDAIAGVAEQAVHTPRLEAVQNAVAYGSLHVNSCSWGCCRGNSAHVE